MLSSALSFWRLSTQLSENFPKLFLRKITEKTAVRIVVVLNTKKVSILVSEN